MQKSCSVSLRVAPPSPSALLSRGMPVARGRDGPSLGESSGLSLEGRSWGKRKECKAVSRSVMAVIIYLFMYFFLLKRRWSNEQEALPALRGGAGGNGALATHAGLPPQPPQVLSRISSMLAPSPSTLRLCLCHRGPTLTWASVSLFPIPTRSVDTRARAGASEDVPLPSLTAPFPHPTW